MVEEKINVAAILGTFIVGAAAFITLLAMLFVLFISLVYLCGYIYDVLFPLLKRIWILLPKKVKEMSVMQKIKCRAEPREKYSRYETPAFAFCFSYMAVVLISVPINIAFDFGSSVSLSCLVYLLLYFIGMRVRYNGIEYKNVLSKNLEFLKLSFLPLSFLIIMAGFFFTATGSSIKNFLGTNITNEIIIEKGEALISWIASEIAIPPLSIVEIINDVIQIITSLILVVSMCYVVSLPIQLVSYYLIYVIKYLSGSLDEYKYVLSSYWKAIKKYIFHLF